MRLIMALLSLISSTIPLQLNIDHKSQSNTYKQYFQKRNIFFKKWYLFNLACCSEKFFLLA
jgi:hypothetical protein